MKDEHFFRVFVYDHRGAEIDSTDEITQEEVSEYYDEVLADYPPGDGYTFRVFEYTCQERKFNIIDPVPARLALI